MSVDLHSARAADSEPRPQQRYPRSLFSVPVTLRHRGVGEIRSSPAISLDLSEGGLGAIVSGGLQVGQMVEIDIRVAECALRAVAIVRYTTDVRSGFEFVGLTPEKRRQIANATGHA
jgi:hypothetical protein